MKRVLLILWGVLIIGFRTQRIFAYDEPWINEWLEPATFKIDISDEAVYTNRYAAYLDVIEKCIEQYGETDYSVGPSFATQKFTGLSFLKLVDFNRDGVEELMLVFNSKSKEDSDNYNIREYVFNIWSYDGKQAVLLQDGMGLLGGNGGIQVINFVDNQFGTFLHRGAGDSFEYNFYYGYKGDQFGLSKTMIQELEYNESKKTNMEVYSADDVPVSKEFYHDEKQLWNGDSSLNETYVLTFSNDEDKRKILDSIEDTIRFLKDQSQELTISKEKGKTLLKVPFSLAQDNSSDYTLVQKNLDTGEEKNIALLNAPLTKRNDEDQDNTLTYDFSTQLHLESGSYQFYLIDQKAEKDAGPVALVSFEYDETEKTPDDDVYGNEREYRRLLSQDSSPMENEQIVSNIKTRLSNAGFSTKKIKKIITYLKEADKTYQNLYLYTFYKYTYKNGQAIMFIPKANTISIHENKSIDVFSEQEFYTTFFHEAGHAIDYYSGDKGYYSLTVAGEGLQTTFEVDLDKIVKDKVVEWMRKNPGKASCTKEELCNKISNKLYSADPEITREDCHNFSGNEFKAYQYVEKQLQSKMFGIETLKNGDNLDMRDVLMGFTCNKIAKIFLGKKIVGHQNENWWDKDGMSTGAEWTEGWAECYTALLMKNSEMIKSNSSFFPSTCEYLKKMAIDLEDIVKSTL